MEKETQKSRLAVCVCVSGAPPSTAHGEYEGKKIQAKEHAVSIN